MNDARFDQLLKDAEKAPFSGWNFSWLEGRFIEQPVSWDFGDIVKGKITGAESLLDLGTGGGEFLSSLAPLPKVTWATESWPPNRPIAAERLRPFGAAVIAVEPAPDNDEWAGSGGVLPFSDQSFDLVISRHESYSPKEVSRVLKRGGTFLTEQLGGNSGEEARFRSLFAREPHGVEWGLAEAEDQIQSCGLSVLHGGEEFPLSRFLDVGALAYYLKAMPWVIEGFSIEEDRLFLRKIHDHITATGSLDVRGHLYWLEATRSE